MIFCALSEEDSHNKPPPPSLANPHAYVPKRTLSTFCCWFWVGLTRESQSTMYPAISNGLLSLLLLPNEVHCIACEKDIIKENNK